MNYFLIGFGVGIVIGIFYYYYQKRTKSELQDSVRKLK